MKVKAKITGIQHVGIPTNDMQLSVEFYQSIGFEIAHETINPASGERVVFLELGNLMMEIYESSEATHRIGAIDHVALDVVDIEDVFQSIRADGHRMLDPEVCSLPFWEHGVKFFTILGPNEEKIEFCERIKK